MIQKLDADNPTSKKDVEKYIIYQFPRRNSPVTVSIWIPQIGNKNFEQDMIYAMEQFAIHFTEYGCSIARTFAEFVIEYLKQEVKGGI